MFSQPTFRTSLSCPTDRIKRESRILVMLSLIKAASANRPIMSYE